MKKINLLSVILMFTILLFGCNNGDQESQKTEEEIKASKQEKQSEKNIIEIEEKFPPDSSGMVMPSVSLLSSKENVKSLSFDHSYEKICWNDCDEVNQYNYPDIHSGDVEVGNQLQIDWSSMKPQPTEINLIQIDNSDEYNLKELNREQKNPENTMLKITIEEDMIGNQYALEFIWKDEVSTVGRSTMNFKLRQ